MQQQPANSHDGSHQPTDPLNPTLLPVPPPISLSPPLLFVVVVVVATFNSHNGRRHPHEAQDHRPRRALRRYVSRSLCTSFPPPLTRSADVPGKTSLVTKFVDNQFQDSYFPTIENTSNKSVTYNGVEYDCDIIDTAGQVCYPAPRSLFPPSDWLERTD